MEHDADDVRRHAAGVRGLTADQTGRHVLEDAQPRAVVGEGEQEVAKAGQQASETDRRKRVRHTSHRLAAIIVARCRLPE